MGPAVRLGLNSGDNVHAGLAYERKHASGDTRSRRHKTNHRSIRSDSRQISAFRNPHIDHERLLGVEKVTTLCRAKRGKIPSFRMGTMVRFDPQVISRWLFEQGIQSLSSQKTAGKFLIARIAEISGRESQALSEHE